MSVGVQSASDAGPSASAAGKLSRSAKAAYALGGAPDIFGHWLYHGLSNQVFVTYLGLSPTQLSTALFTSRLTDAFTDPVVGWLSDNTRSKWGRRRPYILFGSLAAGLALPCLFMVSVDWSRSTLFAFVLVSSCLYAPLISLYNTPYQSLGAELSPDYDERTSVMSWRAIVQTLAAMLVNWAWWFASRPLFNDRSTGQPNLARGAMWAATIAGVIVILSGCVSFLFVRERYYQKARDQEKISFWSAVKQTLACRPYLILLGTALLFAVPTAMYGHFGYYVQTYYVFSGDAVAASTIGGASGVAYGLCSLIGVPIASAVSNRFGKREALKYTLLLGAIGLGSSYWLYTPSAPWLCIVSSGIYGVASSSLWVVLPSICADVVDFDELSTRRRREGAFSSIFSWVLKLGMSLSLLVVGPALALAGFDSGHKTQSPSTLHAIRLMFAGLPALACLLALLLISFFPLSRGRMTDIRAELEARRGTV